MKKYERTDHTFYEHVTVVQDMATHRPPGPTGRRTVVHGKLTVTAESERAAIVVGAVCWHDIQRKAGLNPGPLKMPLLR